MENIKQMSMLEVAIKLMNEKRSEQPIDKIIRETLEMKGLDDPEGDLAAQLYIDITSSSCFVYMGEGNWDLKSRQSLEQWDKNGAAYAGEFVEDSNNDDTTTLDNSENDEIESQSDQEENDEEISSVNSDDDDDDGEYYIDEDNYDDYDDMYMDEDSYNDIMDDYEDMYD